MKRILSLQIAFVMLLFLCACGQKAPTWQEQYDLGVRYLTEGNYEEAIIAFTAAIEIDPKKAEAYKSLAETYTAIGDIEQARLTLIAALDETGDESLRALIDALDIESELMPTQNLVSNPVEITIGEKPSGRISLFLTCKDAVSRIFLH